MKKGEKAVLTCGPEYAYGSSGIGPIPAFATLKFQVELLDFSEARGESSMLVAIAGTAALGLMLWNFFG